MKPRLGENRSDISIDIEVAVGLLKLRHSFQNSKQLFPAFAELRGDKVENFSDTERQDTRLLCTLGRLTSGVEKKEKKGDK